MYSKYVDSDGVAAHYVHSGASTLPGVMPALDRGELFVFVHDAGANLGLWRRLLPLIAERHSVIALDLPGHGRSGSTEGLESVEAYAEFLSHFVEVLELRPHVVVGKGLGASIAMRYATLQRREVRGLVLLGGAARVTLQDEMVESWRQVMLGRSPQPFSEDEFAANTEVGVKREAWTEQIRTDPRVRYHDFVAWRNADLTGALSEVRQPVLVVSGAEDRIVAPALSQELCPMLPNARMDLVDDAGHTVELERPQSLADRIQGFVATLEVEDGS